MLMTMIMIMIMINTVVVIMIMPVMVIMPIMIIVHYSDWVCTAVMSNDVMKDLRGDLREDLS